MAQTISDIIIILENKIKGLEIGGSKIFKDVLTYPDGDFKSYPAAEIFENNVSGIKADTHRHERTFSYTIKLYQEQGKKTKQQSAEIMRAAVDAVIIAFDQDEDLGGQVEAVRVVSVNFDFKVVAGSFNFAMFKVDVVALVNSF